MSSDVAQKRISGKSLAVNRGICEPRIVEKSKYISGKDFFKSEYNCMYNLYNRFLCDFGSLLDVNRFGIIKQAYSLFPTSLRWEFFACGKNILQKS